jgi:hypothetical protein
MPLTTSFWTFNSNFQQQKIGSIIKSLTPGEITPSTHWLGGLVDPRAGLDDMEKILDPTGTRTQTPSVIQPVASRYTNCSIPAPW